MKKLLAEFIEQGWIESSDSEWACPASIVLKKEKGELRLVVDYRGLNDQTKHDSYSLPLIDTILQKQQKRRIFTVLDLKHGYHQMPLHLDSRPCTAILTPGGRLCKIRWKGFAASRESWEPPSSFVPRYTTVSMDYLKKSNISLDVKDVLVHLVAAKAP